MVTVVEISGPVWSASSDETSSLSAAIIRSDAGSTCASIGIGAFQTLFGANSRNATAGRDVTGGRGRDVTEVSDGLLVMDKTTKMSAASAAASRAAVPSRKDASRRRLFICGATRDSQHGSRA